MANGYPEPFIVSNMRDRPVVDKTNEERNRQTLALCVPFRGDAQTEILKNRINRAIRQKFPQMNVRLHLQTKKLWTSDAKDRRDLLATSLMVYQFTCICNQQYIGRSKKSLSTRVKQHLPGKNVAQNGSGSNLTAITTHLLSTGHHVEKINFKIIYKANTESIMKCAEAIAIAIHSPSLNKQKYHSHDVQMDWRLEDTRTRRQPLTQAGGLTPIAERETEVEIQDDTPAVPPTDETRRATRSDTRARRQLG